MYVQFTSCFYGRADLAYGLRLIVNDGCDTNYKKLVTKKF